MNSKFVYKKVACLVIDEADRICEIGFQEEMEKIINLLPSKNYKYFFFYIQASIGIKIS